MRHIPHTNDKKPNETTKPKEQIPAPPRPRIDWDALWDDPVAEPVKADEAGTRGVKGDTSPAEALDIQSMPTDSASNAEKGGLH